MLRKLLKYEFKHTAKDILSLFGVVIILSVLVKISMLTTANTDNSTVAEYLLGMFMFLFILSMGIMFVGVWVILIIRFYKNMYSDEGYLTATLPVTATEHIFSKFITGFTWVMASAVVCVVSFLIIFIGEFSLNDMWQAITSVVSDMRAFGYPSLTMCCILILVNMFVAIIQFLLAMQMIIAIGACWPTSRIWATILTFIIYTAVIEISNFIQLIFGGVSMFTVTTPEDMLTTLNGILWINVFVFIILSVASFFVTRWLLSKKINLA